MAQISAIARERIQAQGFCGLSDATYSEINYPLRLSPGIMMLWERRLTQGNRQDLLDVLDRLNPHHR